MLETAVQLQGINNTARENDLNALQLRSAILCLNMIMLPVSAGLAYMMRGPTAAKVCAVILESIFDNLFIAVGVALQLEVSRGPQNNSFWEHLSQSAPTLVPAVLFFTTEQTPLMILAKW